jgi:hypothetical protein
MKILIVLGCLLLGACGFAEVPFPHPDESVIDPEVRRLVGERVASKLGQDLHRTEEIDRMIIAKGSNAVPSLIAMAQTAADTDPLVLGQSQDYGNELRCLASLLAEIGDRRAIQFFSALVRFDTKPGRMYGWLRILLCHGTDKQLEQDAQSPDPNVASMAQYILLKERNRKRVTSAEPVGAAPQQSQPTVLYLPIVATCSGQDQTIVNTQKLLRDHGIEVVVDLLSGSSPTIHVNGKDAQKARTILSQVVTDERYKGLEIVR